MKYTYKEIAELKNVSVSAVYSALKRGDLIADEDKKIDLDISLNKLWVSKPKHQYNKNKHAAHNRKEVEESKSFESYIQHCSDCKALDEEISTYEQWKEDQEFEKTINYISTDSIDLLDLGVQKERAAIEYKKNQTEALALKRAKEEQLVIDIVTIRQALQTYSGILNEFISLPDSINSTLVAVAKESENPEFDVANELREKILDILKRAKEAEKAMTLEDKKIVYYFENE